MSYLFSWMVLAIVFCLTFVFFVFFFFFLCSSVNNALFPLVMVGFFPTSAWGCQSVCHPTYPSAWYPILLPQ